MQSFLLSGTPLFRLPYFKPVLEKDGFTLPSASNLAATYIPRIEQRELQRVQEEIAGEYVGVAFDGTSRLGEALSITGRVCTEDFVVKLRLLRLITSKLHVNASQLASLISTVLCTELRLPSHMVVCFSRDSVLVNASACRLLTQSPFTAAENLMCIAHTLNNVGSRIHFDVVHEFMTPWLELVGGRSPHRGAQALWRATVRPTQVPGFSNVRWHSKAEIEFVLAEHFDRLHPFLARLDELGYGDATRQKMNDILNDGAKSKRLGLQLAAMLDMKILVSTTYELEGDRLELLLAYDRVERLRALGRSIAAGASGVLFNLDAALRSNVQLKSGVQIEKVRAHTSWLALPRHAHISLHVCCRIGVCRLWSVRRQADWHHEDGPVHGTPRRGSYGLQRVLGRGPELFGAGRRRAAPSHCCAQHDRAQAHHRRAEPRVRVPGVAHCRQL